MTPLARAALAYAEHGWAVFPQHQPVAGGCSCGDPACTHIGKHPRISGGVKSASVDLGQVAEWWSRWPNANIGLAPVHLLVLDIDPRHGGDVDALDLPRTPLVETGGGGWHIYLQTVPFHPRASAGDGLDIRTGHRPVTLPPSLHASGRRYRWLVRPGLAPLAPCPDWLVKAIAPPPPPPRRPIPAGATARDRVEAAVRYVTRVPGAPEGGGEHGGRDKATYALACKLLMHFGDVHPEDLVDVLTGWDSQANDPPLGERAVRQKFRSAERSMGAVHA